MKSFFSIFLFVLHISAFCQVKETTYDRFIKHFNNQEFAMSAPHLDSLLINEPDNFYWLLNKAEVETQLNNYEQANDYIEKLIEKGYFYLQGLNNNSNLSKLKTTDRYKESIKKLTAELEQYKLLPGTQQFNVQVPPLMECYVIMLYLLNPSHPLINSNKTHFYFQKVDSYFSGFKNSTILQKLPASRAGKGEFIENLRTHHNLVSFYPFDGIAIDSIKRLPIEIDYKLLQTVHDFAVETNFMKFYNDNTGFYNAMKKIMTTNYLFGKNIIPFFNQNFSSKINQFNIYFSPLYSGWGYGPSIQLPQHYECFYFGGIMHTSREFYYPNLSLLYLLITEFDHSAINELSAQFSTSISKLKSKMGILNTSNNASFYGTPEETLNEYITWAFALQFFYEQKIDDYEKLEKFVITDMEGNRGFKKFSAFMSFYKGYINNRKKYPKLKDFYPEIIGWVQNIK